MTTQPEALRLADLLQDECGVDGYVHDQAAAELRRLHAENEALQAENAKLHGWFQAEAQAGGRLQRRLNRTEDQRDALLEALKMVRDADDDRKLDGLPTIPPAARAKIDAAIKTVEGEKA